MALNFPNTPTDGQVYTDVSTGNRWAWDSANTCWKSTSAFTQSITIAASAPGEPVVGQLWWNQEYGRLLVYYSDGTSTQWVDASPSDYTSTQAFNQSNNAYAMANASFNMANGSYTTANLSFVSANTANTNVGKAYDTANAAFAKANNALANTSGTVFNGSLLVSSNVRTNTIQGYGGTNYIVDGYPRMPGQVIEYLASPCDGSTITGASGSYTWPNVTGGQSMTTSYQVITGSSITYTPPIGTSRVIYDFDCSLGWADAHAISHWRLYLAGVEVVYARVERGGYYPEDRARLRWIFNIGGVDNTNTGRVATWTTGRTIQWQARDYSGGNRRLYIHSSQYWDGAGAAGVQFMMPTLSITAIA